MSIIEGLNNQEKAAILIISLGKDYAANLYRSLTPDEIEQLTLAITSIHRVEPETRDAVLEEFHQMCMAQKYIAEGGIEFARDILDRAIGTVKANEVINKLTSSLQVRPFDFIRRADPKQIINFIQNESLQTISLILTYLTPQQSALILAELPPERQTGVISRIATMGSISPEYIKEAERILERKLSSSVVGDQTQIGGVDQIVEIINASDRTTEKHILEGLDEFDQELADQIRNKLFVFEDVAALSNATIQRILKEVDNSELALALKVTTEKVTKVIFENVSKRLASMIKEEMDYMGPVRVRDVEEAQQKIVNVIRQLEDAGEITISRGDDMVV